MRAWKAFDAAIVRSTEIVSVAIGLILLLFLTLGIVGRYITGFSVSFVEIGLAHAASMVLPAGLWFGSARKGACRYGPAATKAFRRAARAVIYLAHAGSLIFYAMVLAGTHQVLTISASTTDPSLGISGLWGMISVPIGFSLLVYHQIYLIIEDWLRPDASPEQQQLTK